MAGAAKRNPAAASIAANRVVLESGAEIIRNF
jgi:hypothetical protein